MKKDISGHFKHVKVLPDGSLAIIVIEFGKVVVIRPQEFHKIFLCVGKDQTMNYIDIHVSEKEDRQIEYYSITCPDKEHMEKLLSVFGFTDVSVKTSGDEENKKGAETPS
ncbi:MAG: hypothetical protein HGB03_01095 [Candidatus Yonathbacteria bacterium]|nr:hypothetical protein [Candidatus Yonathbacteria bacterium]NTW47860.1 hypothetical protein [Candidatus Yonathbacteria bacterium]